MNRGSDVNGFFGGSFNSLKGNYVFATMRDRIKGEMIMCFNSLTGNYVFATYVKSKIKELVFSFNSLTGNYVFATI